MTLTDLINEDLSNMPGLDAKILKQIEKIVWWKSKTMKKFPFKCCKRMSEIINKKTDLSLAVGYFIGELNSDYYFKIPGERFLCKHWLNYDEQSGYLIDTTIRQFDKNFPKVFVIHSDDPRLNSVYEGLRQIITYKAYVFK